MSYRLDLDELPEETLHQELARREKLRHEGRCDYCGRILGIYPACKFPERHAKK